MIAIDYSEKTNNIIARSASPPDTLKRRGADIRSTFTSKRVFLFRTEYTWLNFPGKRNNNINKLISLQVSQFAVREYVCITHYTRSVIFIISYTV